MLPTWYKKYKTFIEDNIEIYLDKYLKKNKNNSEALQKFEEVIRYSIKWGKKIRAILALEFYLIFSNKKIEEIKKSDNIILFCIALELLHAYSLVHDDLPAMDNDILRRWEKTTWKKFWETNAILVWDLLNSLSFEVLTDIWDISLIKYFWKAVWINWMLWGQVLDLYYENNPKNLNLENLIETHNKKTWELIKISILWWIILANLDLDKDNKINKIDILKYWEFWEKLGLAFQIKDDILDVEWTKEETGKSVWDSEEKWFVYFLWSKETHKYLDKLILDSKNIIWELNSKKLNFLVEYIWNRKK